MWNPEDTHKVTEAIYKNITSNFNNGVRQILTAGKAYHKALVGMTSSAHSFIEAIGKVGYTCQVNGQGGTDEIGGAILKLADIQKEMYAKVEECTKALFSEVILPLEHRLENDFKHAYAEHKKYQHGHKGYISPYIKAQEALKKFRKKSKSKFTFDDSKEAQHMRAVAKCQEKLTEFRTQGLKLALLEERKCYCYLLERLTAFASVQTSYTKKGYEMLASEVPHWKQLCSQPHILPRSADPLVNRREQRREAMESSQKHQNGMVYPGDSHYGSPYHRPTSSTEYMRQKSAPSEYAVPAAMPVESKTLPRGLPSMTQGSPATSNVQAIYAHTGRGEDQLSFNDGDVLTLIGEKSDGWQYGLNAHTGKFGWFPLSFTDAVGGSRHTDHSQLLHRAKSIGDLLDSRSQISDISISYEVDMPGRSRRPRSLYESSMVRHITPTSQPSMPITTSMSPWSSHLYHTTSGDFAPHMMSYGGMGSDTSSARASSGFHTLPRPSPQVDMGSQELYQTLPDPYYDPKQGVPFLEMNTLTRRPLHDTAPHPLSHPATPTQPRPPHPPPHPPHDTDHGTHSTPKHVLKPLSRNPSMREVSSQRPARNTMDSASRSPALTTSHLSNSNSTNPSSAPPPPPLPPMNPISTSSSVHPVSIQGTTLSQILTSQGEVHTLPRQHDQHYQTGLHQQVPQAPQTPQAPQAPPPPPPPVTNQQQQWSGNASPGLPPPPPPTDYIEEEEQLRNRNPMFANVALRKTLTNDRSAPRLK